MGDIDIANFDGFCCGLPEGTDKGGQGRQFIVVICDARPMRGGPGGIALYPV